MTGERCYKGWTNYETWAVNLWICNEEPSYRHWRAIAQERWDETGADGTFTREENAASALAGRLRDEFEEANPLAADASIWSDLLGVTLSEVNWVEIARHLIDDCDKTDEAADEGDGEAMRDESGPRGQLAPCGPFRALVTAGRDWSIGAGPSARVNPFYPRLRHV